MTREERKIYMRAYRENNPEYVESNKNQINVKRAKKRICPDCGVRELDKKYHYCSECGEARRYIALVIYRHNWNKKNIRGKS